jgi:DNA polymerase-3 subunit epsilon
MNFVSLDVETANASLASICQIGIVHFDNGQIVDKWSSLIDPEDFFDFTNVSIHGIDKDHVDGAPTFHQAATEIERRISGQTVVIHTSFDRSAITQAHDKYGLALPECAWLDTAKVARRTWPDVARKGYGLSNLAQRFGIEFNHHDALEDARAAGIILLRAIDDSGMNIASLLELSVRGISRASHHAQAGNLDGQLFGEVIVFTGTLSLSKREASELASRAGCEVADGVTKHTTLLVVGDQDIHKLAGHEKSIKHRKALGLIAKGQPIRILAERDFAAIVGMD